MQSMSCGRFGSGIRASKKTLAAACTSCAPGYVNPIALQATSTACKVCTQGKYSSKNSLRAINCPREDLQNAKAFMMQQDCTECQAGRYNNQDGQRSESSCIHCDVKFSIAGASLCDYEAATCPPGTFTHTQKHARDVSQEHSRLARVKVQCARCTLGRYGMAIAPVASAVLQGELIHGGHVIFRLVHPLPADPALYRTKHNVEIAALGSTVKGQDNHHAHHVMKAHLILCRVKVLRTHVSHVLPASSTATRPRHHAEACPAGTYNDESKSTSENDCRNCQQGRFNSVWGRASCEACHPGTFNDAVGQEGAVKCPPGTFLQALAQTSLSAKYVLVPKFSSSGAPSCKACPSGWFCLLSYPSVGILLPTILSCTKCPLGWTSGNESIVRHRRCDEAASDPLHGIASLSDTTQLPWNGSTLRRCLAI